MTPHMHREPGSTPRSSLQPVELSNTGAAFERVRPIEMADEAGRGFETRVGRAIAAPVDVIFDAWTDGAIRKLWLGGGRFRVRRSAPHRLLGLRWEDGSSVEVQFFPHGPDQAFVRLEHRGLRGRVATARAKAFWEEKLARLKVLLEGV